MSFIVTTQGPVPLHAPPQPVNVVPAAGVAVSVTVLPLAKLALQVPPQLIPAGLLMTVPVPLPVLLIVSVVGAAVKVAATVCVPFMTTTQGPVPLQAPPQPAKVEPPVGVAVSVTVLPLAKLAEQVPPQSIPAGVLVTVPVPVLFTESVAGDAAGSNCAFTIWLLFVTTTQDPVPVQAPLQPANVDPPLPVAVRVTEVPPAKLAEQEPPQEIPLGMLITVPVPEPVFVTVTVAVLVTALKMVAMVASVLTVQAPVPEHPPPLQPANAEPGSALAVNVTAVPPSKSKQLAPQAKPDGEAVTVPLPPPLPCLVIITRNGRTTVIGIVPLAGMVTPLTLPEKSN